MTRAPRVRAREWTTENGLRRAASPIAWAAFMLVLTSIPNPDVGGASFPGADKLVHFALYAVLGWLCARAWLRPDGGARAVVTMLLALAAYAALDEWHQRFIAGRAADPLDWTADVAGAASGVALRLARRRAARHP